MSDEAWKVLWRRFSSRMLESGLLIAAVALGVGATAAGFSLLANTQARGAALLASPAYREIVVATQTSAEDMDAPAVVKPASDNAILTAADLAVGASVPAVRYSYISSGTELRFMNAKTLAQRTQGGPGGPGGGGGPGGEGAPGAGTKPEGGPGGGPGGPGGPPGMLTADELAQKQAEADVFLTDVDQLRGYEVTPSYFDAWNLKAAAGSVFASSESQSDSTLVVLGATAAAQIAGTVEPKTLIGKKILTWEGYASVVGILASSGTDSIDQSFFTPYQTPVTDFGAGGPPRRMTFNTQLRFAVADPSQLETAAASLTNLLTGSALGQLVVTNPRAEAQKLIHRNTGIGLLILFLALAALFIASLNVSHILVSRGLRMRRGVGILMALGASKNSILGLFAGEGVFLSTSGSLAGALLAWPLDLSMESALGVSGGSWVFLAVGVAGAWMLNLVFSVVPAVQNSQIPPAEAMRSA